MTSLESLGQDAYKKILSRNYRDAAAMLTHALDYNPDDYRIFSNRAYCFLELGDHHRARLDAVQLKEKFPHDMAGYFILGEILLASMRYKEAEAEFHRALQFSTSDLIAERLFEAQMHQIIAKGVDALTARRALLSTRCVQDAMTIIAADEGAVFDCVMGPDMIITMDEEKHLASQLAKFVAKKPGAKISTPTGASGHPPSSTAEKKNPLTDPANPLNSNSIWVGNLTFKAEDAELKKIFGRAGKVESVHLFVTGSTGHAFVNYGSPALAGRAMAMLQGTVYNGKALCLKFPDRYVK